MLDFFKQYWSSISTATLAVAAIVGATLTFEARYASAADVEKLKIETRELIRQSNIEQSSKIDSLRRQQIEDRLFELRLKEKPSTVDRAIIKRYEEQIEEIKLVNRPK